MPLELINPITYTDTQALSQATSQASLVVPAGTIVSSVSHTTPTGFLLCDGSNTVSRTTYSNLFNAIVPDKGTVTISVPATPTVITLNNHGFLTGESIFLTTTGALPTGLAVNTLYFIVVNTANTFWLSTTYANAIANTRIATSGTQSGVHTLFYCPYGLGSNTSNFKLPDFKNATIRGRGLSTAFTNNDTPRLGNLENDSFQGHTFTASLTNSNLLTLYGAGGIGPGSFYDGESIGVNVASNPSQNGNGLPRQSTETRMKNQGVNFFIKF